MRVMFLVGCALLGACSGSPDKKDAAPTISLIPQAITYPDIEANKLYGASCSYASGKSMAPIVIAFNDRAVMKVDGKIESFKLDPQCTVTRQGTGSRYLGDNRVLDLAIDGEGSKQGPESINYMGSVKLSDGDGNVLYQTDGAVQCGS